MTLSKYSPCRQKKLPDLTIKRSGLVSKRVSPVYYILQKQYYYKHEKKYFYPVSGMYDGSVRLQTKRINGTTGAG